MENKIAVVTGGSSGIGKATCELLARNGYKVFELSRSGSDCDCSTHVPCDVTDTQSVDAAFSEIERNADKIDLLVSNAGFGISGAIETTPITSAEKQFDVNFFGAVAVTNRALAYLRKAQGKIVFLSSVAAVMPIPFQAFYSASKAAINSFAACLANEVRPFGIGVCAVMPGDTKTGFTDKRVKNAENELYRARESRSVAAMEKDEQNGGSPEKIAKVILRVAEKKRVKPLYTCGTKYKFFVFLGKLLPAGLLNKILYAMYAK